MAKLLALWIKAKPYLIYLFKIIQWRKDKKNKKSVINWQPIKTAPADRAVFLWAPQFVDDDFNPTGVVDGFLSPDDGWTCWQWNNCQDMYSTIDNQKPTLWADKVAPNL